jgi:hypothetical protein
MSQTNTVGKDKPSTNDVIQIKNQESSADLQVGSTCCFNFSGTEDGVGVVSSNTGAAAKATSLFAGIVLGNAALPANTYGRAQRGGLVNYARVLRATRAASTDTWASIAALTIGDLLAVDTVNNALQRTAAGAASAFLALGALAQTLASVTTLASSVTSTTGMTANATNGTALYSYMKVHLRTL